MTESASVPATPLRWAVRLATWGGLFLFCLGLYLGLSLLERYISPAARLRESIQSYTASRPKQQTLGAIVLVRPYGWYFKISGPDFLVEKQREQFEKFVRETNFSSDPGADPAWTLPDGWKQEEGNEMRFATIQVGTAEEPLAMTVTQLPMRGDDVLNNVNRWRKELGLAELTEETLAANVKFAKSGPYEVTFVNLANWLDGAPVQGNAYADLVAQLERMNQQPASREDIKFKLPAGWKEVEAKQFQTARILVGTGDDEVEISISEAGGDLAMNINRWRGQVGLEPAPEEQIASALTPMQVSGFDSMYIELVGPEGKDQEAILGIIAHADGRAWFIKLRGPAKPALAQKQNFQEFARSLELE